MFIITGANGHLGGSIVRKLIERVPPSQVGATCRDPSKAADLTALGVRVRHGDFNKPDGLPHAFEGASRVLIVSSNARAHGGDPLAQHRAALDACLEVGVDRVLYTSHMAASDHSAFAPMHDHHATEAMLGECGLPWTALRNGFYAASGAMLLGDALRTGVIEAPADGKVAWTAHADLAEAAARVLASDTVADGPTAPLVADQALDLDDLAVIVSALLGRPCRRTTISDEEMRTRMMARGMPEAAADFVLGIYIASRHGEFTADDDTLSKLLGHRPTPMRDAIIERRSDVS